MNTAAPIKAAAWDLAWTPGTRLREYTRSDLRQIAQKTGLELSVADVDRTLCPGESLRELI